MDDTKLNETSEEAIVKPSSKKKFKKKWILIFAVSIILIAVTVALVINYFDKKFNAINIIDDVVLKINTSIDSYKDFNSYTDKIANYSNTTADISAKFSSNNKNLEYLNNYDFKLKEYSAKDYFSVEMVLDYDKKNLFNLNGYYDNNDIFIESKDIYDGLLRIYFKDKEDQEKLDDIIRLIEAFTNSDAINDLSKTEIEAYAEALKLADISRTFKGTTINYKISINETNIQNVNGKFDTIINKNPIIREIKKFAKKYNEDNEKLPENVATPMALKADVNVETDIFEDAFSLMTIDVDIDLFSKEIKYFKIVNDDTNEVTEGTLVDSGKYKIGNEDEYEILEYSENKIAVYEYKNKEVISELLLEKKNNKIVYRIKSEEIVMDLERTELDGSMKVNINDKEFGKIDGIIKYNFNRDKNELSINMSFNTEIEGYKVNFKIDGTEKYGDNLFAKKDLNTYKNIGDLSETEFDSILKNITDKFMQFE